eukprot:jgi/Bigna1/136492/aug1.34_g11200
MAEDDDYEPVRLSMQADNPISPSARSAYWRVCALELIAAFGDRLWLFAIPILFQEIWPRTLLPVAIYNFVLYLVLVMIMPYAGNKRFGEGLDTYTSVMHGNRNIAYGSNSGYLTNLNSALRRVDLVCKFIAPMSFGFMLEFLSSDRAARIRIGVIVVAVACWAPALSSRRASNPSGINGGDDDKDVADLVTRLEVAEAKAKEIVGQSQQPFARCCKRVPGFGPLVSGWGVWWSSEVRGLSLGYTLLYGTILAPGPLLTAYLKSINIPEGIVGATMGLGAVFGLIGTVVFKPMTRCMSLPGVGLASIWLWCIFLAPTAAIFLLSDDAMGLLGGGQSSKQHRGYVILACVTVGRIWLWAFDLAETKILQEWVMDGSRGRVAGCQSSLCTMFALCVYGLSVAYHEPGDFYLLVFTSFGFVVCGTVVTTLWYCFVGPYPAAEQDYLNLEVQFLELNESKEPALFKMEDDDYDDDDDDDDEIDSHDLRFPASG